MLKDLFASKTAGGLSADQRAQYERDGFLVVKNVVPQDQIARWLADWEDLSAKIDAGVVEQKRHDRLMGGGNLLGGISEAYKFPGYVAIMRDLLGPDISLYLHRPLIKDKTWNGPVETHQDCVYSAGDTVKHTIFTPLTPFTPENGNLWFCAGSHRFGNLGVRGTIKHEDYPQFPPVNALAMPGDIIIATYTVWHFSLAGEPGAYRPLLQSTYQDAACGHYAGLPPEPVLVSGRWKTDLFSVYGDAVIAST